MSSHKCRPGSLRTRMNNSFDSEPIIPHKVETRNVTSVPRKPLFFRFTWWNGGGKIRMRLATNPVLKKLLDTKPDVFVYGEAETPSPHKLLIRGFMCYLHKSKLAVESNYRRGLAIFYRTKYRFIFTKVYASRKYDIVWMRLKTTSYTLFFCFFYAPGSHHLLPVRTKFYDDLFSSFSRFAPLGKVYLTGDTNARLGSLLNDRNSQGQLTSNANKPLFLEFLEYTGLEILNKRYCIGVPTFEIVKQKRSIIDLCLTNSLDSVRNFEIEPTPLGVNSQTGHKALTTTLLITMTERAPSNAPRRTSFRRVTLKKRTQITLEVTNRIKMLNSKGQCYTYSLLSEIFFSAKQNILGIRKNRDKPPQPSAALRDLQNRYRNALAYLEKEKTKFAYFAVDNLEKLLNQQYVHEKNQTFSIWLRKMNDLDFRNRTRDFFSEIRSRQKIREEVVPIWDSDRTLSVNLIGTLKNWSEYYKKLYASPSISVEPYPLPTPGDHTDLDKDLSLTEFIDVIYSLKNYKSPGYDHITNEDIVAMVMEDPSNNPIPVGQTIDLLRFIFNILSDFWFNECVPRDFKRTILRPFLKDNDKPSWDPSNYRPISLLNTLMKIYEGIICDRVVTFLDQNSVLSPFQAAYRKGRSPADHILILHELFLEYRFNKFGPRGGNYKKPLYFCFLDFRKAFDTVPRHILFSKLYEVGIRGKTLRVIQNLFSSNPANVLIGEFLSPEFLINRGVLQGSKLGPILFNVFINDLLKDLEHSGLGASIGPILIAVLGFADDIVLISDHPDKLQGLINLCQKWAQKNMMSFNTSKCKVIIFNEPPRDTTFTLSKHRLEIVKTHKYLGIILSSKYITNLYRQHFSDIISRSKIKSAIISRHGFHEDGLRLSTAIKLYTLVIRPVLEYSAQTLTYGRYSQRAPLAAPYGFAKELEHNQTQILKKLISCPRSTPPAIVRLFCGVEPIASRLEILKLRYLWKILNSTAETPSQRILKHRQGNFLDFNKGFAHEVFDICCKYNVLHFWHGDAANLRVNPFRAIKNLIIAESLRSDLERGRDSKCCFATLFLRNPTETQKRYRILEIFRQPNCFDTPDGRKRVVKALLHPCSYPEQCTNCGRQYKDKFFHFLTDCQRISGYRKELLLRLSLYNFPSDRIPMKKVEFMSQILERKVWRKYLAKFLVDTDF